jgi:hypothetical protein
MPTPRLDRLGKPVHDCRRKAEGQFVDQQIARACDHSLRDHHHLLLAAR